MDHLFWKTCTVWVA